MSTAVLSLEAFQERQLRDRFRARAHEALDELLNRLEARMTEPGSSPPTLMDLTEAVSQQRSVFTSALVEAFVERRHGHYLRQEEAVCPRCERVLQARPERSRTVETLVGPVTLERPYFYCVDCQHGFAPLDEALGLSARRKQWDVQHAGVKLALEMPHERASMLLEELTDASMSDGVIHEVVQRMGQLDVPRVCPGAEEIHDRIAAAADGRKWKPIVVLAVDAADVPSRPETAKGTRPGRKKSRAHRRRWKGEYHEAKGFRFYLVDDDRIVQLISWHQVGDEEAFGAALRQVVDAGLIPEDQVRLCAIGDGSLRLSRKLWGHYAYYGNTGNGEALSRFKHAVDHLWRKWLSRRTNSRLMPWDRFARLRARYPLPRPRVVHSVYRRVVNP